MAYFGAQTLLKSLLIRVGYVSDTDIPRTLLYMYCTQSFRFMIGANIFIEFKSN